MKCPRCKVEMVKGIALYARPSNERVCFWSPPLINAETLDESLIDCLKCPECGHSDTGK